MIILHLILFGCLAFGITKATGAERLLWRLVPLRRQTPVSLLIRSMPDKWDFTGGSYCCNYDLNARFYLGTYTGDFSVDGIERNLTSHEFVHVKYNIAKYRRLHNKKVADESLVKLAERIVKVYSHE